MEEEKLICVRIQRPHAGRIRDTVFIELFDSYETAVADLRRDYEQYKYYCEQDGTEPTLLMMSEEEAPFAAYGDYTYFFEFHTVTSEVKPFDPSSWEY